MVAYWLRTLNTNLEMDLWIIGATCSDFNDVQSSESITSKRKEYKDAHRTYGLDFVLHSDVQGRGQTCVTGSTYLTVKLQSSSIKWSILFFSTDAIYSFVWEFHQCFLREVGRVWHCLYEASYFLWEAFSGNVDAVWSLDWEVYGNQWFRPIYTHTHKKKGSEL